MEDENSKIRQIPVSAIIDPESPIRSRADESALYQLADSIRDVGLIQPLLVKPRGDKFEVVTGHRRFVACKLLGLPTVPCIVASVDDASIDAVRLHENLFREDVNVVDQARLIKRVMDKEKLTVSEVARKLRRGETYIRSRLNILTWDPELIEAVELGKIKSNTAYWFSKITDPLIRKNYLRVAIKQGISGNLARDWYHRWQNKGMPEPPPPTEEAVSESGEKVEYYKEVCPICGKPIAMGEEMVIFVHPDCWREVKRLSEEGSPR